MRRSIVIIVILIVALVVVASVVLIDRGADDGSKLTIANVAPPAPDAKPGSALNPKAPDASQLDRRLSPATDAASTPAAETTPGKTEAPTSDAVAEAATSDQAAPATKPADQSETAATPSTPAKSAAAPTTPSETRPATKNVGEANKPAPIATPKAADVAPAAPAGAKPKTEAPASATPAKPETSPSPPATTGKSAAQKPSTGDARRTARVAKESAPAAPTKSRPKSITKPALPPKLPKAADSAPPAPAKPATDRMAAVQPAPDSTPPPAAEAPAAPIPPSFDVVRINLACRAVAAGRAEPGATVTLLLSGEAIATTQADRRGEWVIVVDQPLPSGPKELTLIAKLPGEPPIAAEQAVVLLVPDCVAPVEERGDAIAVLTPKAGPKSGASTVLQAPPPQAGASDDLDLSVGAVDYDESGNVAVSGRSKPGSRVQAYVDNEPVGGAETSDQGRWRIVPEKPVEPGVHELRIDQLDETGKVLARIELPFSRAAPGEFELTADRVIVQPGNSLWRIARRTYGQGVLYTVIYQANGSQIRDPDLIYPGQIFVLPTSRETAIN